MAIKTADGTWFNETGCNRFDGICEANEVTVRSTRCPGAVVVVVMVAMVVVVVVWGLGGLGWYGWWFMRMTDQARPPYISSMAATGTH